MTLALVVLRFINLLSAALIAGGQVFVLMVILPVIPRNIQDMPEQRGDVTVIFHDERKRFFHSTYPWQYIRWAAAM